MKSINVFIYGDKDFPKKLGKLGSHSDIALYNRKVEDHVFTFITPLTFPEKIQSMLQSANMSDAAIVVISALTPELGEVIVALSEVGQEQGIIILENLVKEQIKPLIRETPLEKYTVCEKSYAPVIEELKKVKTEEKSGSLRLTLDHFFLTKTIGPVGVGRVERGAIKKHAKLIALPSGKDVVVKSLQVQDENVTEAGSSTRVGVALKGVEADELGRGCILTDKEDDFKVSNTLRGRFSTHRFFKHPLAEGQKLQLAIGLQFETVVLKKMDDSGTHSSGGNVIIEVETGNGKNLVYEENEKFVISRPEVKGLRIVGSGNAKV